MLLAWDRLILPGGRSIALDRLPGADSSGMAGLADRTDHHWGHMIKAALVSTLLGVGAELGASDEDRFVQAVRGGVQDSVNETGRNLVERQLRIPPTIMIRPGFALPTHPRDPRSHSRAVERRNPMTKLRLGPVAEDKPVKLTLELPGVLMRDIFDYARVHARLNALDVPLPPERIVPAMIDRFIAGDREFTKQRHQT